MQPIRQLLIHDLRDDTETQIWTDQEGFWEVDRKGKRAGAGAQEDPDTNELIQLLVDMLLHERRHHSGECWVQAARGDRGLRVYSENPKKAEKT